MTSGESHKWWCHLMTLLIGRIPKIEHIQGWHWHCERCREEFDL